MKVLSKTDFDVTFQLDVSDKKRLTYLVRRSSEDLSLQRICLTDELGQVTIPLLCENGGKTRVFLESVLKETGELEQGEEFFVEQLASAFVPAPQKSKKEEPKEESKEEGNN